jgi:hypothetical protein
MIKDILKPKTSKEILTDFSERYDVSLNVLKDFVKRFRISSIFELSTIHGRVMFCLLFFAIGITLGFLGEVFTKLNFQLTGGLTFISGCILILGGGCVALFGDDNSNNNRY